MDIQKTLNLLLIKFYMIKIPKKPTNKELINFFRKKKLKNILNKSKKNTLTVNQLKSTEPYKPELLDLYIIFQLIKSNKRISCLEYGSGWSSLLIALALNENEKQYKKEVSNLRRNYRFKNLIIDNEKKYLSITKKRIEQVDRNLLKHSDFIFAALVEELGFVGGALLIGAYGWLIIAIMSFAHKAETKQESLFCLLTASLFLN